VRPALALLAVLAASAAALAQDGAPPAPSSDPEDYRWAIYTSCSALFAAVVLFLLVSHARARRASEEIGALERRLDDLEKRAS
jgi:hypothetical protein